MLWLLTVALCLQVHDIFYPFIQTTEDEFSFIWVNESKTGFSHLYKITSLLQPGCHRWAEGYRHTEGKVPGDAPAFIFHYLIKQSCCFCYCQSIWSKSTLIRLSVFLSFFFSVLFCRRLQMCNQGGGYFDQWRMGSAGKTRFQG